MESNSLEITDKNKKPSAIVTVAAALMVSLLAFLPCQSLIREFGDGAGWILVVILAPIMFFAILLIGLFPLLWLLQRLQSDVIRLAVCIVASILLLLFLEPPGYFEFAVLVFVAISFFIGSLKRK